jgi:hypothetical protein
MLDFTSAPKLPAAEARLLDEVRQLPQRHRDIESGVACPMTFAKHMVAVLSPVLREGNELPLIERRMVWTTAGMATAAAERHFRRVHRPMGEALRELTREAQVPAGDWFLKAHRAAGDVVPRLSHLSYWQWVIANEAALSFTGSRGELLFRSAVQQHVTAARAAVDALAVLVANEAALPEVIAAIRKAIDQVRRSWSTMAELARAFDHRRGEFATDMRQFLVAFGCPHGHTDAAAVGYDADYAVGDKVWSGPNAANFVHAPVADQLLGLVDERYAEMVRRRFDYFTVQEQALAREALAGSTALDWLAAQFGMPAGALAAMTADAAAAELRALPVELIDVVAALTELAEVWMFWSGAHFGGGVQRHVGHAARHIGEAKAASLPVPCTKGASGNDLAEVTYIYELRRVSFLATTMRRAVRMTLPAANEPAMSEGAEAK